MSTAAATSPLETLTAQLADSIPMPLEPLEVAAVLESIGVTDAVAAKRYGTRNVFELADNVFNSLQIATAQARFTKGQNRRDVTDPSQLDVVDVGLRGLLALAPLALLLSLIQGFTNAGWTRDQVFAFSFGASLAMLLTAGPIIALGRRVAMYAGLKQWEAARMISMRGTIATLTLCGSVSLISFLVGSFAGVGSPQERAIFAVSLVAFALVWLLLAELTLARRIDMALSAVSIGCLAGALITRLTDISSGIAGGYAVATLLLFLGWTRVHKGDANRRFPLPATGPMLLEAVPYIIFGTLSALFVIGPHLLGWFGNAGPGGSILRSLTVTELGFMLALPAVVLATGVNEIAVGAFWEEALRERRRGNREAFNHALGRLHRLQLRRYSIVLALTSSLALVIVEVAHAAGAFPTLSQAVFLPALAGGFLLGFGQFNCQFALGFSKPKHAIQSLLFGLAALVAVGVPLATLDFRLSGVSFAVASLVFAASAWSRCRKLIRRADHVYHAAL